MDTSRKTDSCLPLRGRCHPPSHGRRMTEGVYPLPRGGGYPPPALSDPRLCPTYGLSRAPAPTVSLRAGAALPPLKGGLGVSPAHAPATEGFGAAIHIPVPAGAKKREGRAPPLRCHCEPVTEVTGSQSVPSSSQSSKLKSQNSPCISRLLKTQFSNLKTPPHLPSPQNSILKSQNSPRVSRLLKTQFSNLKTILSTFSVLYSICSERRRRCPAVSGAWASQSASRSVMAAA